MRSRMSRSRRAVSEASRGLCTRGADKREAESRRGGREGGNTYWLKFRCESTRADEASGKSIQRLRRRPRRRSSPRTRGDALSCGRDACQTYARASRTARCTCTGSSHPANLLMRRVSAARPGYWGIIQTRRSNSLVEPSAPRLDGNSLFFSR